MKGFIFFLASLFTILSCFGQNSSLEVNPKFKKSIQNLAKEIKSLDSEGFSDLLFLKDVISNDKQYVFIGESSHEVAEFNILRTRLINFLHEQMGFNIIAIEEDMGVATFLNFQKEKPLSVDSLVQYIDVYFGCEEMRELICYLRKTNIKTTGFDVQLANASLFLPAVRNFFVLPDSIYIYDSLFCTDYKKTIPINVLSQKWKDAIKDIPVKDTISPYAKNMYKSIQIRADWMARIPKISSAIRDSLMAANFLWLINHIYPNEKIIILAHNEHIAKSHSAFKDGRKYNGNMGQYLQEWIGEKSYVLGTYAYQGQTGNYGPLCTIVANRRNSLGAIFNSTGYEISFCDFLSQKKSAENKWMFKKIKTVSYCFQRYKMIPAKRYDGIIMIKNVHKSNRIKN
ncbi:MAG TPA: erythromycin esterase family protein [Bacteroidales bacterium]|mgnify:CR=1 FL=1|nr:erythromycin esterase family protein [Bacteroidales bacterium]